MPRETEPVGCGQVVPFSLHPASKQPDARTLLFAEGAWLLQHMTGVSRQSAGGVIVKLLQFTKDDAAEVLHILRSAADLRPARPMEWIMAAGRQRSRPHSAVTINREWGLDDVPSFASPEALAAVAQR